MNDSANDYDLPDGVIDDYATRLPTPPSETGDKSKFTIKDFAEEDRPQEKALAHGCKHLSVAELWALILRSGQPGVPITEITRNMMRSCGNKLHTLQRLSRNQLMLTKGLGTVKALQIEALFELITRFNKENLDPNYRISTPQNIYDLMRHDIGNIGHEEIWAIFLNRRNEVIEKMRISAGSSTATVFDSKMVLKEALLLNSEGIVLVHNHPSGATLPSGQDDNLTSRFKNACSAMDIRFLDHVIVTHCGFYSYQDAGKL